MWAGWGVNHKHSAAPGPEDSDPAQLDLRAGVTAAHTGGWQGELCISQKVAPIAGSAEVIPGRLSPFWKLRKTTIAGAEGEDPDSQEQSRGPCTSA